MTGIRATNCCVSAAPPDRRVQDARALRSVLEEIKGRSPQIEMREFRAVRKDGGVFDAEAHASRSRSGGRWIVVATIRTFARKDLADPAGAVPSGT